MLLINTAGKKYIINDPSKSFHCTDGMFTSDDLSKAKPGDTVKTNTGKAYHVIDKSFIDEYKKIKRGPQVIPRKDIGLIITECGLNKGSVIIESGAGSGATGSFLAKMCKKVYSYEIREDFAKTVKGNILKLGLKNYKLYIADAKDGFKEKDVDAVILDLPDPWELIQVAKKSLKIGGFLVSYSPTIPQTMDFVQGLDSSFMHFKTSEIIERKWEVKLRKVRPMSQSIGHSGFLSFARRIK
jgi:tRNA (adenine57-N1/adenine58-N1)-methyltransferase catalytic subunit